MNVRSEPVNSPVDPGLSVIMSERCQLIGLAYRLLSSLADAEDVAHETYARWYAMSPAQQQAVDPPGAWLTKGADLMCPDAPGAAKARRERYDECIPEPIPGHADGTGGRLSSRSADPADRVTLSESITMSFLVVLESMPPAERVAFMLHDVFQYPYAEIADIVGRTPAACRQFAASARRRIRTSYGPTTRST
ncbi:sigma factor-like helix-turn-helix DNA-binding protein [Streptomyces flavofungini]|uniref:Uncharacterized protein n=1 Tax=Streptomyces flavofungini TaxID=68200 RepID=A0ABS0XBF8_9ACTN|nr:sigma factor-like helix-turn-helix DNA-binding protein [Streptomyces flavofungini]MBJ3810550.1 hypothetical protein [Streptomyces flavofungini]GHC84010.1 hypothetical protein GCM10010349_68680 [Streptomyces flavofungini]